MALTSAKFIDEWYNKDVCGKFRHFFAERGFAKHKTIRTTLAIELKKQWYTEHEKRDMFGNITRLP